MSVKQLTTEYIENKLHRKFVKLQLMKTHSDPPLIKQTLIFSIMLW